jgi:hypothetical protein
VPRFVHSVFVEVTVGGFGEFVAVVECAVFAAIEAVAAEALDVLFAEDIDML